MTVRRVREGGEVRERSGTEGENRRAFGGIAFLVAVAVAATVLGAALLGFFGHGMRTPVAYSADTLLTSASIKGIIDNGQPFTNPYLAAPGTSTLFDFPGAESFFLLEIRLLALFTHDYALLLNLFVLLGYPLVALAAAWAMRTLGASRPVAFVFALLYACIPFHQSRAVLHQSLSMYFAVPLAVALVIGVVFDLRPKDAEAPTRFWRLPLWAWLAILAIGTAGVYYAYFAMALAVVAAAIAAWSSRDARRLVPGAVVVAGVLVVIVAQMVPSFVYWQQEGRNNLASARIPAESDLYALRMTQLVFPVTGHRIARLAQFKAAYEQSYVDLMGPEYKLIAYDSSLGLIGTFGFLLLLLWLLSAAFRRPPPAGDDVPAKLTALGVTCFLLATVGGVGEVVAYLGFPAIRAYDRMTPYLAFLSLAAVAWFAEYASAGLRKSGRLSAPANAIALGVVLALVLAFGVFDQTTPATVPDYAAIERSYSSDGSFVADIEGALPSGAMIFQLPYIAFPESAPVGNVGVYDPLRLYLHSKTLHWSAGAFRGREDATWQARVSAEQPAAMIGELRAEGFDGLVVDREGYADRGAELEGALQRELGEAPIESTDGRFAFFGIGE